MRGKYILIYLSVRSWANNTISCEWRDNECATKIPCKGGIITAMIVGRYDFFSSHWTENYITKPLPSSSSHSTIDIEICIYKSPNLSRQTYIIRHILPFPMLQKYTLQAIKIAPQQLNSFRFCPQVSVRVHLNITVLFKSARILMYRVTISRT